MNWTNDVSPHDDQPDAIADRFDAVGHRAGAVWCHPEPTGEEELRRAGRRQRLLRSGMAGAACLALALGVATWRNRDVDRNGLVAATEPTTAPEPAGASTTTPSTALPPATDPVATVVVVPGVPLTDGTQMAWGGGFLLGVLVGGRWVPYAETSGVPASMIDNEVVLVDRAGGADRWTVSVDPCGQPAIRPAPSSPLFGQDLDLPMNWSENYEYPGTLDGAADVDLTLLRAALARAPYGGADRYELFTPTESLDADPELETLVRRFVPGGDPGDPFTQTWLAVWDPSDDSLLTLKGSPDATNSFFRMSGEGPTNVNGDSFWEDLIVTPSGDVQLIQLADGKVLAQAGECRS
ncbi:MAG: hypothetical protein WCC60_04190 [Ilumatobacteraceae bacterium]